MPADVKFGNEIAIDTETLGLNHTRDRLCLVQISAGDGNAHLVQFAAGVYEAPNLKKALADKKILKIFHYARFDIGVMKKYLKVDVAPVYCTKIASRLTRTYTDKHGLKDLCSELTGKEISKQQQSSDWGAENLTQEQLNYAASDVLYLHEIKEKLNKMLKREKRQEIAQTCFDFLPTRVALDLAGWQDVDIFQH